MLSNLSPANGAAIGNKPSITGLVSEPATIVAEGTSYIATVTGNTFSISPALAEGLNAFTLLATDAAGNQSRLPYSISVRTIAPSVDIVENGAPIPANALFSRNVTPVIRASDPAATVTATLNGAPFTSGTAVTADGSYTITAKATDTFGHASDTATATFRIDKTPPAIKITQPLDGATLASAIVAVSGTVSADAKSVSVNGVPAAISNGTFTATVTLDGFDGAIAAFAVDEAGNAASDRVDVVFEGGTLAILLTSPADKLLTNRPRTVVAGQIITPADAESLTINNTAAAFDAAGSFLVPDFALTEGENPITATVKKRGGQSNSVTVVVTADFTPPVLKVLANSVELAAGARFAASPAIVAEATDNNPGVTTRLTIDGTVITGAVGSLSDGGHSLTAVARDAAGNETRVDRTFFIGSAGASSGCGLSNIDPPDQAASTIALFNETVQINGRSGGAAAVLINGVRAEVSEGSFCGSATLVEGRNEITIQCANADGTPTTDSPLKVIYYRYLDPVITIAQPAGGEVVTNAKITVTGTVSAGVIEGSVNGIRFTVPNDGAASHNFSVPDVTLAPGLNVISARAQTMSMRGGVATVRVKLLSATPQIGITSPLTGTSTGATSVGVSGTFSNVTPGSITVTAGSTSVTPSVTSHTDTTGTFSVPSVSLANNGKTTITVSGRNAAGVLATASIEVEQVATAPQITIATPADNTFLPSTATGAIHVTGTINDVPNASVQVNGIAATLTGTSFSADVEPTATTGGATPIIARVTLPDGRSATDAARVIRFSGPLSVRDVFPSNDATDVDAAVVVLATVSNPLDGSSVAGAFKVTDSTNTVVPGDLYVDRDAISFAPQQALKRGERYTIAVAQSLKDASGAALNAAFSSSFTIGTSAPNVPPVLDPIVDGCFTDTTVTGRVSVPGARVQLEVDGVEVTKVSNATTGAFEVRVTFSGQPGFHSVRAREMGGDGTLSPERAMCVHISCAAPRVVAASLDRAAKKLTIQFSKPMDPATLIVGAAGSIRVVPDGAAALAGTIAMNALNDTATITFAEALPESSIALTVTRTAKDTGGAILAAEYTQVFTVDGAPPSASGKGYISGAVYDATKGRQLSGATIQIAGEPPTITNDQGRYASRPLGEGAYTIQASAPGRTTVWRQVVVPVGAGVLPIDIRLTERGPEATANGTAQTLAHGADTTVTKRVELSLAAASLTTGRKVRLTSVGAQSLAGLLPLGWSPLAAAEIVVDNATEPVPMPGAKLTFIVDAQKVTDAAQTLSIVQYDSERDEWRVAVAAANVSADGKVSIDLTASGNYALVYPDKAAHLTKPATAHVGAALSSVANPCLTTPEVCLLKKIDFQLNPQAVLPNGRSTATLTTEGAAVTQTYPSGTAVQAYIDEELNLADGRVLIDPPFATDLLVYRDLAGTTGVADFHLAPTPQAAAAMLRDGADHIRVVDYPGRIDRGTLIGADGGRVPGDDAVTIDIPSGATTEPLHAAVSSLTAGDLASYGSIAGFRIAGGFNFTLTPTSQPEPVEGSVFNPTQLIKPARATFSVSPIPSAQVIVAEVLSSTPYGVMFRMVSATTASTSVDVPGSKVYTTRAAAAGVPISGLVRAGRYLILASDSPIAYAYGQVRTGDSNGLALANARVTSGIGSPMTATLGVTELTRTGGVFVVPVAAAPAPAYSLQPRSVSAGDGAAAVAAAAPAADTFVNFGALVLSSQPPQLMNVSPDGSTELDAAAPFNPQAVFNVAIDPASVANGVIIRNVTAGTIMAGTVSASGGTVRFVPAATEHLSAATQYSITVAPTIRTLTGTPFGRTVTKQFRTLARVTNKVIHPELISITIPDANGKSTISGRAGALPTDAQVIAVRRARNFIVSYETTVTSSVGAFSFDAGHEDPRDRISIEDDIDLRVIDGVSHAVIAVIPLTFASTDGRTVVANPNRTVTITSDDGISITIEAGTFDVRTPVTILPEQKTAFARVPQFDAELNFSGAVQVKFDGVAKKRMQIEMKAPENASAAKTYFLGYLGQSIRGPRVELADTLRLVDGRFTTTLAADGSARGVTLNAVRIGTQEVISNPADVKRYLIGVLRSGIYATVDLTTTVGWGLISGVTAGVDMFWDSYASLFASQYTFIETRGRALIPVAPNKPFLVVGVDASTGLEQFRKVYDPIGAGNPMTAVVVPAPVDDQVGPYPVFASPARFEVVDTAPYGETLTSVRGIEVKVLGNDVHVKRTEEAGFTEVVNVHQTAIDSGQVEIGSELAVTANANDRVLVSLMTKNVDAFEPVSITFQRPLYVGASTDPEAVDGFFHSGNLIKIEAGSSLDALSDVTGQVEFSTDSQNRRVMIDVNGALQLDRTYRITISRNLQAVNPDGTPGLKLAQKLTSGTTGPELADDIHLFFTTRAPGGQIAEMNLSRGVVRDLGINGNIALVAALTGGIQAFDISDPAALNGTPTAVGRTEEGIDDMWGIASDRHDRVYATGLSGMFGFVRTYRLENFIPDAPGTPKLVANDQVTSTALVCWRVGASAGLPLTTSYLTVSDRPEAIPRKIQVLLQDDEVKVDLEPLINPADPAAPDPASIGNGFYKLTFSATPDPAVKYKLQRVTIENRTAGLHWSKDVRLGGSAVPIDFLARRNDDVYVVRNQMTYGVISLFGYGIGVFDLNAMESNDANNLGGLDSGAISEKVVLTDVKPCQPNPYAPCSASDYEPLCPSPADAATAPAAVPCPIREIYLTPESLITTGPDSSSVNVYALDSYRGVLDLTIEPPAPNPAPPPAVLPANVMRHPGLALGRSPASPQSFHQRLLALRDLYRSATGREPRPRFQSIAPYLTFDAEGNKRDYALITGRDFGLLVVKLDGAPLTADHLVDVVWIPAGAVAVRVIPRSDLAVVVDGAGRVLLVNLKKIDESSEVDAIPSCTATCPVAEMFPTALAAASAETPPLPSGADWFELGVDDPRIIWKSAPKTVMGTLAPVIDAETGILFTGDVQATRMRAIAATDPHPRVMVNTGDPAGYRETGAIVPLGIDPPTTVTLTGPDASLSTFRIEVTLPGSITESLVAAGNELRFAIESERTIHAVTGQTPDPLPVAHLRRATATGGEELRPVPAGFRLSRLVPYDQTDPALYKLRFQRGYNRFVSPWVVALADPRASSRYKWDNWNVTDTDATAKREHGCPACKKPAWVTGTAGVDYFEIYSAGRFLAVRPEVCRPGDSGCVSGNEYFESTPYKYLGHGERLVTRVGTIMADTIRPTYVTTAAQAPPIAGGALQETIFTHSGELMTGAVDHDAGGRAGWNVAFDRTYRSRTIGFSPLARGWDSSIFQRLRELPNRHVEYRDGTGEMWEFTPEGGAYKAPTGLYLKLTRTVDGGWRLVDQKLRISEFDALGRLVKQSDEFYNNTGGGNAIRYFYDRDSHLVSIIDPVNRATGLYWTNDRLDKIKDWRNREVFYHYDAQGRLERIELPRAKNPAYPAYDHSFDSTIRNQHYTYSAPSSDYSDAVELDANLLTIREPGDDLPRVTYEYHTGAKRDMVHYETWGTEDEAKATFDFTMPGGTFPSPTKAEVADALKQKREYTFADATQPKDYTADRAHATTVKELEVATWDLAGFGALPTSVSRDDDDKSPRTRTFTFGFTEGRMTTSALEGVSSTAYGYDGPLTNNDYVLTSRTVTGTTGAAGLAQTFDHEGGGAFLTRVTSGGLSVDSPEAHNGNLTITATDGGVQRSSELYPDGLLKEAKSSAVSMPASGAGDFAHFDYYPPTDTEQYRRGLLQHTQVGEISSINSQITYGLDSEDQSITGRSYTRHTDYDEIGRVLRTDVTGTDVNARDEYAYDARGRLVRRKSKQKENQWVEDRYEYDRVDRLTAHEVWQGGVAAEPYENRASRTEYEYDMPTRQMKTTLPADGVITRKLDGLGREEEVQSDPRNPTFTTLITQKNAYDLDDNLVFSTDGSVAMAQRYDAVQRPLETIRSDATSARQSWDGWSRLTKHEEVSTGFVMTNAFTDGGQPLSSQTNSLRQDFEWDGAGRTRKVTSNGGASEPVRESQLVYDSAGRLISSKFGQQGTSATLGRVFQHLEWIYGSLDQPSQLTAYEDNDAHSYRWTLTHDALGRATRVENQDSPDLFVKQTFDELGNVTSIKTPERRGTMAYAHDGRGLPTEEKLPPVPEGAAEPKNIIEYDANGVLKKYTDATGEPTDTLNDGLGRPLRRTYADGSTEEIFYVGSRLDRFKDRQNRWQDFDYDDTGRLFRITNGSAAPDLLTYHPDGRIFRWSNANSITEFNNYDAEGRPHLTRQTRLRQDGTALDTYTQTHEYNGFGQRTSWTMPGEATFGSGNWTRSVEPVYDAAGNVVELKRVLVDGGTQTLMNAEYRAAGRPKFRMLHTNIGTASPFDLERRYEYSTDDAGRMSAFRVFADSAAIVDPILLAGSEVQYEGTKLSSARLLGLSNGERTTQWRYDDRGRLAQSSAASTEVVTAGPDLANAVIQHVNDVDFLKKIEKTAPGSGVATDKEFTESENGHKVEKINAEEVKYKTADAAENGSLRTEDGRFYYVYDEKARLRRAILKPMSGAASVMQVAYEYNTGDRMIGRRVEVSAYAGQPLPDVAPALLPWTLATALQIGPDAVLPPDTTFVWDPISDQLAGVFDAGTGKPIRQYIHGGLGLDDPIEVAVAESGGVARYYPIYDEAGDGGLQVVLTADAKIVARTVLEDPYGDGELAISGPAVDAVRLNVKKANDGTIAEVRVEVRLTETVDEATLATGGALSILDVNENVIATVTEAPDLQPGGYVVSWTIPGASWNSLTSTPGAFALSIGITRNLRSTTFGPSVGVLEGDTSADSSIFTEDYPFEWREPLGRINSRFGTLPNGGSATAELYVMSSLSQANAASSGSSSSLGHRIRSLAEPDIETADSASALMLTAVFQAQPFTDPFTLKNYVRARWYDPATGTWLGPDPMGYQDSSNLYAFAGGDPINRRDPTGTDAVSMRGIFVGSDASGRLKKVDYRKYYNGDVRALYQRLHADKVPMHLRDLIVERVSHTDQGTARVAELAPQVVARVNAGVQLMLRMEVVGLATVATGGLAGAYVAGAGGGTLLVTTVAGAVGGIGGQAAADVYDGKRSSLADYGQAGLMGIGTAYIFAPVASALDAGPMLSGPTTFTPRGLTLAEFDSLSQTVRNAAGNVSDDIVVQGSRAAHTNRPDSDLDIAILVDDATFDKIIQRRFKTPNPGSANERTMQHAIKTGKIQAGEAGYRQLRKALEQSLGMEVDVSIIRAGGPFDKGPTVPLRK
ncbi:MAG: Ig-like domain-containing protein [Thermoanaerobaculia bacterium]